MNENKKTDITWREELHWDEYIKTTHKPHSLLDLIQWNNKKYAGEISQKIQQKYQQNIQNNNDNNISLTYEPELEIGATTT